MDIERLKILSGIADRLNEEWTFVDMKSTASTKQADKQFKANNTDIKNQTIADVRTVDPKADIANDVTAEIEDIGTTLNHPTAGKRDAAGQAAPYKNDPKKPFEAEIQTHTISIAPNGAPVVDDATTITMVKNFSNGDNTTFKESVSDDSSMDMIVECVTLTESMANEIKDKLAQGVNIQLSVLFKNDNFSAHIVSVDNNKLTVRPTSITREKYGIKKRESVLPLDIESLEWSDKHDDRVIGTAKPVEYDVSDQMGDIQVAGLSVIGKPLTEMARQIRNNNQGTHKMYSITEINRLRSLSGQTELSPEALDIVTKRASDDRIDYDLLAEKRAMYQSNGIMISESKLMELCESSQSGEVLFQVEDNWGAVRNWIDKFIQNDTVSKRPKYGRGVRDLEIYDDENTGHYMVIDVIDNSDEDPVWEIVCWVKTVDTTELHTIYVMAGQPDNEVMREVSSGIDNWLIREAGKQKDRDMDQY